MLFRSLDELPAEWVSREGSAATQRMAPVFSGQFPITTRPRIIDTGAWEVQARPVKPGGFAVGSRVFHQKFGYGRVTGVDDDKLDIAFEKAGQKRVLDRFVEISS